MLEQLLRQLALSQPDADKPDWRRMYLKLLWGALSMCAGHPFMSSKVLHPRALFYELLSAALHFDQYFSLHTLLVAFILATPLSVGSCHGFWIWALFYLKVGAIRLASFIRIKILRHLPPPGRPPDWRRSLPYYMMRRVRRRCFQTKSELLRNRAPPILVGYGALPYSHESLREFMFAQTLGYPSPITQWWSLDMLDPRIPARTESEALSPP
jgi:hypothetical protein